MTLFAGQRKMDQTEIIFNVSMLFQARTPADSAATMLGPAGDVCCVFPLCPFILLPVTSSLQRTFLTLVLFL